MTFRTSWKDVAPIAADIGLTGGAGSLVSAFSLAASGAEAVCEVNPISPECWQ